MIIAFKARIKPRIHGYHSFTPRNKLSRIQSSHSSKGMSHQKALPVKLQAFPILSKLFKPVFFVNFIDKCDNFLLSLFELLFSEFIVIQVVCGVKLTHEGREIS